MKTVRSILIAALASGSFAAAQVVYTDPVGYVSITCPASSDTIVGLPLRQLADYSGSLSAGPDTLSIPDSAVLSLSGTPGLTVDAYANAYYVKFKTPELGDGQWFQITSNAADSITVDLNGDVIEAVSGAELEVLKFWTLGELFPPSECTSDPATTGNAIVASTSTRASGRRSMVLIPNTEGAGINLASSEVFYVLNGEWRASGSTDDFSNYPLWPDLYIIIRHPSAVTSATTYTVSGEVELGSLKIPLTTQTDVSQDNFIAVPRPVDVTLNQLNLGGTAAFQSSTSTRTSGRRDQLLLFDNTQALANKAASAVYYFYNNLWRISGSAEDQGGVVIPAGSGFIIRKCPTVDGATAFWQNPSIY